VTIDEIRTANGHNLRLRIHQNSSSVRSHRPSSQLARVGGVNDNCIHCTRILLTDRDKLLRLHRHGVEVDELGLNAQSCQLQDRINGLKTSPEVEKRTFRFSWNLIGNAAAIFVLGCLRVD